MELRSGIVRPMMLLILTSSMLVTMVTGQVTFRPPTTPRWTTLPGPTTIDPSSCQYDGRVYQNGEDIERDPENCYGMYCEDGHVLAWDAACFFGTSPCDGERVDVPGQCCPDCIERTTTPTTTPPKPRGCYVNDTLYAFGADIPQKDPCKRCTCTSDSGVMCTMAFCGPVQCVNPIKRPTDCCPTCPDGPNCWYGRRKIAVGDVYKPRVNVECTCPEPYEPLAICRKIPENKDFLGRKLRRQSWFMNPMLKAYIEQYLAMD